VFNCRTLCYHFRQLLEGLPGVSFKQHNAHPKLSVETATQLAVFLANRLGALPRVCDALAMSDTVDHTVRMVVSDPIKALMPSDVEKARRAFEEL
jgi:hypothetical protein